LLLSILSPTIVRKPTGIIQLHRYIKGPGHNPPDLKDDISKYA
jgi:hypothetical protein